jgi:hypothetical protein
MDRYPHESLPDGRREMGHKRTTGWGLTRNEAALLGAIIGYGVLVVVVTPLLLGLLPLLAVGWMLRVPVASDSTDSPTVENLAAELMPPQDTPTRECLTTLAHR